MINVDIQENANIPLKMWGNDYISVKAYQILCRFYSDEAEMADVERIKNRILPMTKESMSRCNK